MKRFKFYNEVIIEADTEEEAKDIFSDTSLNFAADANCEEIEEE